MLFFSYTHNFLFAHTHTHTCLQSIPAQDTHYCILVDGLTLTSLNLCVPYIHIPKSLLRLIYEGLTSLAQLYYVYAFELKLRYIESEPFTYQAILMVPVYLQFLTLQACPVKYSEFYTLSVL